MYIETRTTAAEVLRDVYREVEYKANNLNSSVAQKIRMPSTSFVTAKQIKEGVLELSAMYLLAMQVAGGIDQLPPELVSKVNDAREGARRVLAK